MNLKPCPYRHVGEEGHILCDKIKTGEREVSPNVCRACPISQINCAHLRATLDNQSRPPIVVRWGNGRSQTWDDFASESISLSRAACAKKVMPIASARDCSGCQLRQPHIAVDAVVPAVAVAARRVPAVAQQRRANPSPRIIQAPAPAPAPAPMMAQAVTPPPSADNRSSIVAQKIIKLQEWLSRGVSQKSPEPEAPAPIVSAAPPAARVVGEEKRAGWTD